MIIKVCSPTLLEKKWRNMSEKPFFKLSTETMTFHFIIEEKQRKASGIRKPDKAQNMMTKGKACVRLSQ